MLNRLPVHDEEMKERLVRQYTKGRTSSLRDMTAAEYRTMCEALDGSLKDGWSIRREQLRKCRSAALKQMQRLGMTRRTGRESMLFAATLASRVRNSASLGPEELDALTMKLRAIERHGGLKALPKQPEPASMPRIIYVPVDGGLPN